MTLREQLENPEIFRINRMDAHSDHVFMPDMEQSIYGKDAGEDPLCDGYVQCLDGIWQLAYSERMEECPEGFAAEDYDLSGFGKVRVPGHLELQGYGKPQYINTLYPWDGVELLRPPVIPKECTPVGSYVRFFDLECRVPKGGEVVLSFGGVETAFSVWLNGVYVGYSEDSFTPSEFCVTELVREKGNRLAVEVYKRSSASWIEDQDFWRFSGIFRSVNLLVYPAVHVYDLKVTADYIYEDGALGTEHPAGTGVLTVKAKVLSGRVPTAGDVEFLLKDGAGKAVAGSRAMDDAGKAVSGSRSADDVAGTADDADPEFCVSTEISVEEAGSLTLTEEDRGAAAYPYTLTARKGRLYTVTWKAVLPRVKPWSAEDPNLYHLNLRIPGQEQVWQETGFRTFEMKDGLMCLNGKRILFRGVNRHEFSYTGGRCISMEDMHKDIRIIKQNNMNAVRTCHYPNRSEWYSLCDEAGLYLIDETNLESHGSWQKLGRVEPSWNVPGDLPQWRETVLDRARSMYERDKNHPSVLIWSCGNESYAGEDIAAMSAYFHEMDPGRLVHYEGVFHNRKYRYISDMESRMYAKPAEVAAYLEEELAKQAADPDYVTKPYISCEYMHAMGNSLGGMQLYTELEDRYPGYQGGFIWDYMDQVLPLQVEEPRTAGIKYKKESEQKTLEVMAVGGDYDDRPTDYGFCTNGIVYGNRMPSPKMPEVRQLYSPIRLDVSPTELTVENRNLFVDTNRYHFVVRTMLDGRTVQEKPLEIMAAPGETVTVAHGMQQPEGPGMGVIEAVAYTDAGEQKNMVTFAQCVSEQGRRPVKGFAAPGAFVPGDGYLGIAGSDWRIQFSMTEGGISSISFGGREYIHRIPRISFWRAMTDNDCGAGYPAAMGVWYAAGHFMKKEYERFRMEPVESGMKMITVFSGGPGGCVEVTVTYTAYPDGRILVEADYPGVKDYPELPVFAMDFCTGTEVDRVTYLGLGPEENYIDRAAGARLGEFRFTAEQNLSGYLRPQECGNRTGVRELQVTGADGRGLRFTAAEEPFEMSVLPYSAYELEEANRIFELPPVRHTWIRIASGQMGVGGDDSWGAPVHDEYRIDSSKPQHLAFWISPIDEADDDGGQSPS